MSDGFVPAVAWSRADFDIAEHEAAHAVIASFYGVPVKEVRIDHPDDVHGVCVIDHSSISDEELRTRARDHVSILLAGPLASGDQVEWPLYGPPGSDHARAATTIASVA
jgi:hypothetical protein